VLPRPITPEGIPAALGGQHGADIGHVGLGSFLADIGAGEAFGLVETALQCDHQREILAYLRAGAGPRNGFAQHVFGLLGLAIHGVGEGQIGQDGGFTGRDGQRFAEAVACFLGQACDLIGDAKRIDDAPVTRPRRTRPRQGLDRRTATAGRRQRQAIEVEKVGVVGIERHRLARDFRGALVVSEGAQDADEFDGGFAVAGIEVVLFGPEGGLGQEVLRADGRARGRPRGGEVAQAVRVRPASVTTPKRVTEKKRSMGFPLSEVRIAPLRPLIVGPARQKCLNKAFPVFTRP
jgi:hypothetical protein